MKALKMGSTTLLIALLLGGCSSVSKAPVSNMKFWVDYHEPWTHGTSGSQEVDFKVSHQSGVPDDLQPSFDKSIVSSRINNDEGLMFYTVHIDYQIEQNNGGYNIDGAIETKTTVTGKLLDSVAFHLDTREKLSTVVKTGFGALATINLAPVSS